MSRRLLASKMPHAGSPTASAANHVAVGTDSCCTYALPTVATKPKKTRTITSPSPTYPYGLGPPVYVTAAAIYASPSSNNHGVATRDRTPPTTAATPNAIIATLRRPGHLLLPVAVS